MKKVCMAIATASIAASSISQIAHAADSIAGVYAMREVVAMQQHVLPKPLPPLGMTVTSHGFALIEDNGENLFITETFCDIAITPRFPVAVTIPEAMTRVISVKGPLLESVVNGKTVYVREEAPTIVGARLADPANDPLPSTADDPRIFDEDGDGKLGITTKFSGLLSGETYSVRRERYSFTLAPGIDGRLEGLMQDRSEEKIIDATNANLKREVTITPDPDPKKTYIQLVPAADGLDCAGLMMTKDKLFAR